MARPTAAARVRAVEIELNQRLDMDEEAGEPLPNLGETERHLATLARGRSASGVM